MKKERVYTKIIVTRLNNVLKEKYDRHCERHGVGGSEAIRCYILNLPDDDAPVGLEEEYTRQIEEWTRKRDELRRKREQQ